MHQTRVTGLSKLSFAAHSLLMATAISGCKAESNTFSAANASVGSGSGSVDANAGFGIKLKAKTGIEGFIHKFGDFSGACEIPATAINTPTSIQCMINMMEYDLWAWGYEYEVTVPQNFCEYMVEAPYYFYEAQPGNGPSNVTLATSDGRITTCSIDGQPGTIASGGAYCDGPEARVMPGGSVRCTYDYAAWNTTLSPAPPNCCGGAGLVQLTATVTTPDGTTTTSSSSNVEYGGKHTNCLDSPAKYIDGWPKNTSGVPLSVLTRLNGSSLARSQKIP